METQLIDTLIAQVLSQLLPQLGADGHKQTLLTMFFGQGGRVDRATALIRQLVLNGYRLPLCCAADTQGVYTKPLQQQLAGFPFTAPISATEDRQWCEALEQADAVLVPLIGLEALTKLSALSADGSCLRILLNALTQGKPLIIVRDNGTLHSTAADPLKQAVTQRFETLQQYGALVCDCAQVRSVVSGCFSTDAEVKGVAHQSTQVGGPSATKPCRYIAGRSLTAADVNMAAQGGFDLQCDSHVLVTPMARDLLQQKRITLYRR